MGIGSKVMIHRLVGNIIDHYQVEVFFGTVDMYQVELSSDSWEGYESKWYMGHQLVELTSDIGWANE